MAVFKIFGGPKFKISEGYQQNWSFPVSALLLVAIHALQLGIGETITYLSGEQFCSQPQYVDQNLTTSCQTFLQELLPVSLPKTGDQIIQYAPQLCQTLFEVCDVK